ncbi:MAG: methyl-accepting chemotaxis protein [Methanoregula sp.]
MSLTDANRDNYSREAIAKMREGLSAIREINSSVKMLSFNARIEAARAGDVGKGFAVVSEEMKRLSDDIGVTAEKLDGEISSTEREMAEAEISARGNRLSDLAFNAIEILDRNLYERTADVRWWATESAFVEACADSMNEGKSRLAIKRMDIILKNYTIYKELVMADKKGQIIANGRPGQFSLSGRDISSETWFSGAAATTNGLEYFVQDVGPNSLTCDNAVIYAAAIREGGMTNGQVTGVLAVIFDWNQAEYIVKNVRLSESEKMARVILFNGNGRVIASSNGVGVLTEDVSGITGIKQALLGKKGFTIESICGKKTLVAYACTPGYETYHGLGWGCAIFLSE